MRALISLYRYCCCYLIFQLNLRLGELFFCISTSSSPAAILTIKRSLRLASCSKNTDLNVNVLEKLVNYIFRGILFDKSDSVGVELETIEVINFRRHSIPYLGTRTTKEDFMILIMYLPRTCLP